MKPKAFIEKLQHDRIVEAIREAEKKTSGEIRVFISRKNVDDPIAAAQTHFVRMGMEKTRYRNAVLIFVAPRAHKFAVVGDIGVHTRCGSGFWNTVAEEISKHFRESDFSAGIIHGIKATGTELARHFPRRRGDSNQLPDEIAHD